MKRLKDVIGNENIFEYLNAIYTVNGKSPPWEIDDTDTINYMYLFNSSYKLLSSKVLQFVDDGEISVPGLGIIARIIYTRFSLKWDKLVETLHYDYNPIENYNMIETIDNENNKSGNNTDTTTGTESNTGQSETTNISSQSGEELITHRGKQTDVKTGKEEHTHSGTDTLEKGGNIVNKTEPLNYSEKTEKSLNNSNKGYNSVYGFNSSETVGTNVADTGGTQNETVTFNKTGNITDTQTFNNVKDTTTHGLKVTDEFLNEQNERTNNLDDTTIKEETYNQSSKNNFSNANTITNTNNNQFSEKDSFKQTLKRSGNIGVTTAQKMITEQRELLLFDICSVIFEDIDSVITISIY